MRIPTRLAPVLVLAAIAVPAPAANAASPTAHVKAAGAAAERLERAVTAGRDGRALKALRTTRREAAAASRRARTLAARGRSAAAARAAAAAATAYDANLAAYTDALAQADGAVAEGIAGALAPTLNGRAAAIALLEQLLPLLPAAAQPIVAEIIAGLSAEAGDDAEQLGEVLELPTLPVDVKPLVMSAFEIATAAVTAALQTVESLIPTLPAPAQGPLQAVLPLIGGQLQMVEDLVGGILGGIFGE